MHVRWRGLELPARVEPGSTQNSPTFGRFIAEPFERGFGTTVGNSMRRILLSSIEGSAITKVRIGGAAHEFTSLPGVMEDVTDIILNVKGIVVSMDADEPRTMRVEVQGPGEITAEMIQADTSITIHNPDHVIATLTDEIDFSVEFTVERGRGYMPASEQYNSNEDQVLGEIPIDAVFSPVKRVRYRTEDTRVGQKTNYDKLILDIWTDGTITPEMSLVESAKILRKHLNPFVQYAEVGSETLSEEVMSATDEDLEMMRKLQLPISELELSVRASNCLESGRVRMIGDLVQRSEDELLALRSFGRTSLREVKKKLEEMGLNFGMHVPEGWQEA